MPAYAVAQITWDDSVVLDRYLKSVGKSLAAVGGKYLAFGAVTVIEGGNAAPKHLAIVEFPSLEVAKRFYDSAEYSLSRKIRAISAKTNWVVWVDGKPSKVRE
jgi:uncharacterized protein (DUF1330 family)